MGLDRITAWRICAERYAADALSGEGARLHGGRWNPPGVPAVYLASARSLAVLEILVHVRDAALLNGRPWVLIPVDFPAALVQSPSTLPDNWDLYPASPESAALGGAWLKQGRGVVWRVPCAVVPGEWNYLLNPLHPDWNQVRMGEVESFSFDPRLCH